MGLRVGELFIEGKWVAAADGGTFSVVDPATEEVIGDVASAASDDVDAAIRAAAEAWSEWRDTDPWRRAEVLRETARLVVDRLEELASILSAEQGKPLAEARGELTASAEIIDWCADEARRIYGRIIPSRDPFVRLSVTRSAVGPVGAFTASNFPALLAARKLGSAFAAGCTVVLKPAEETPFTALALAQAFADAGLPAGVLNVVTGDPAAIADRIVASPAIRKISLTGSVPVGQLLLRQAADRVIPSSLELGGHAAGLIFPDADIDETVEAIVNGKWRNCGQVCIALSRLIVHEDVYDEVVTKLADRARSLRVGPGNAPATAVGPVLNERARERARTLLGDAVTHGGRVLAGGDVPAGTDRGYYFAPTVVTDVGPSARIWTEEPFGPVLPVARFSSTDAAIEMANSTAFGLSGFVFTRDLTTANLVSAALQVGMVGVNSLVIATAEAPAGGVKDSGFGREGGSETLTDYLTTKYVNVRLPAS